MRRLSFVVAMFVLLATMGAAAEGQAKASSKAAAAITTPVTNAAKQENSKRSCRILDMTASRTLYAGHRN